MMSQDGRLALVTGTSSGVGAAVAQGLLREGWTVVGLSRRAADFSSPHYRHVPVDLANLDQLTEVGEGELGPLLEDPRWQRVGLVNNAASTGDMRPLDQGDALELARVFAVNTVAPVYLMGLVVRRVPAATRLRILNVSTGAAIRPLPGACDYSSSKAALRMAGMVLGEELASAERPGGPRPRTAILSYAPGVVDTPMQQLARSPGRPWNQLFVDFHAQGLLQPPEAPAADIVRFLSGDEGEPFAEGRFEAG